MCGNGLKKPFYPPRRSCEARAGLFKFQERSRKQFPLQWGHCEARASMFMWGKDLIKPF